MGCALAHPQDAMACRLFAEMGIEMMLVQSFAKNMGVLFKVKI